jgi:hypothetical protein
LGCCGGSGWQDYANYNMEIPYECRNQVTGNMYVYGCGIIFADYVEPLIGWMSGLALLLVVLQVYTQFDYTLRLNHVVIFILIDFRHSGRSDSPPQRQD